VIDRPREWTGQDLWQRLRRRKVVQWGLAYAAAMWGLLQGVEYFGETFEWSLYVRKLVTVAALLGLPIALVLAWYHGDRGEQRVARSELIVIALLLLIGGTVLWRYEQIAQDAVKSGVSAQVAPTRSAVPQASVAVLPFVALSSGVDDGYFADGLTEEIINALSALPDLLVTARTSAFYFKGRNVPVPQIAATLGVAHVVEGSVRRSGDKARITAKLVRAADGFQLWSETYDHSLGDPFAVQTRIAESVAQALGVLLDERRRLLMDTVGVRDVETFIAFQRGVELFDRAHNEGPMISVLADANAEFDKAIARKPDFAQAYFYHADLYAHFLIDAAPGKPPGFTSPDGLNVTEAERHLVSDLDAAYDYEHDPAQRRVIRVIRTTVSPDWRSLREQIEQAYATWDNCRHGLWIDQTATIFGYGELALAHDARRARCDPIGGDWTREAITAVWLGHAQRGLKAADRIEARRGPDRDLTFTRILAHLALGEVDEAEALYVSGNLDAPDVPPAMSLLKVMIPAAAGRAAEWEKLRPSLASDPHRLLVGAAVFGDRAMANRVAAQIDALPLGPTTLLRIADRCGCGSPFDLEATPKLARLLKDAGLPWSPQAPIQFPLKGW
jgi:TolB-like protein